MDTTSPGLSPATTETDWGYGISGAVGYRYRDFRVEAEALYGQSDADHISFIGMGKQDYETGGVPLHGDSLQIHAVQAGLQFDF
ncbi:MAG: hypothetical protein V1791_15430 [Pseudomonadota bacterium]